KDAALSFTIPFALIPTPKPVTGCEGVPGELPTTRSLSTIEPVAELRFTALRKVEMDPFRTAMPSSESEDGGTASIAVPENLPVIVNPARSIVTKLAVIVRQSPLPSRGPVRFLTSLYEPGWLIV